MYRWWHYPGSQCFICILLTLNLTLILNDHVCTKQCISVRIRLLYCVFMTKSVYVPRDLFYASLCANEWKTLEKWLSSSLTGDGVWFSRLSLFVERDFTSLEFELKLTACCTGSICLHLFRSSPSPSPLCSAFHNKTSLILLILSERGNRWTAKHVQAVSDRNDCERRSYLAPRCIYTGSLLSYTLQHSSGPSTRVKALFSHSNDFFF